jgi:type IV secretion system protein VirD4
MSNKQEKEVKFIRAFFMTALAVWAYPYVEPLVWNGEIRWLAVLVVGVGVISGLSLVSTILFLLASVFELWAARTPTGLRGSAGFIQSLSELKRDLLQSRRGPYWGTYRGMPVFADYEATAYTLGPSGTGKSTKVVQPMVMALKGRSKVVIDFKSELTPVLAKPLRKRGEIIRVINLGELFSNKIGQASDTYNPLCLLADLFWQENGLLEIVDFVQEMALQLYPESKNGKGDDKYFRDGSRQLIAITIQLCVLIDGYKATLGDVLQLLNERQKLLKHVQWVCGRLRDANGHALSPMPIMDSPWADKHDDNDLLNYMHYFEAQCASICDMMEVSENKTFESFISGAQQALAPFNITSLAHQKTKKSSFRFAELKEGNKPTTVFLMLNANKANAQAPVLGLIQWAMLYELKQHPAKHRPVYLIADEATNIPWSGLGSLMTWARGFGIRLHFIFQNYSAFKQTHGEDTLKILLSEAEIVQVLSGQREPETLKMIETMLAERSVMTSNHSNQFDQGLGVNSASYSEQGRALMTADEIRRTDKSILFIRKNKPILIDLQSIAEIAPFRDQIDINPFHGKPYKKPVKLRLNKTNPLLRLIVFALLLWLLAQLTGALV